MNRLHRGLLLIVCVGCAPAAPASHPAPLRAPKRATWATEYVRECGGSITPPLVSPSGKRFVACDAAFELSSGRYLGRTPGEVELLVSDDRAVYADYTYGGLTFSPLLESASGARSSVRGGLVSQLAVSPLRDRIASIEERPNTDVSSVVLRSLFNGAVLDQAPLAAQNRSDQVAFLADGTAVVLANHNLFALENGSLQPLGERFRGLSALAVAENGGRAVLIWPDRRELVELPSGRSLATLSTSVPDPERPGAALDPSGQRVAFFAESGLRIVDVSNSERPVTLHDDPALRSGALRFSPDGRTLLVHHDDESLLVLREGATVKVTPPPEYSVDLPRGFELVDLEPYRSRSLIARYSREKPRAEVVVTASDARQFGPATLPRDRWAALVLERDGRSTALFETPIRFDSSEARAFEFSYFRREGCDPIDSYFRFEQRGDFLYRIEIQVPPGTSAKRVQPLIQSFFDASSRHSVTPRQLAQSPKPPRGPC